MQLSPQATVEWTALRLSGNDSLAPRASKRLKNDELLVTSFAGTLLRMELDKIPLWRGDNVPIKQLVEDFAKYLYLPRLRDPEVLVESVRAGLSVLFWTDTFAYADTWDEKKGRISD